VCWNTLSSNLESLDPPARRSIEITLSSIHSLAGGFFCWSVPTEEVKQPTAVIYLLVRQGHRMASKLDDPAGEGEVVAV